MSVTYWAACPVITNISLHAYPPPEAMIVDAHPYPMAIHNKEDPFGERFLSILSSNRNTKMISAVIARDKV